MCLLFRKRYEEFRTVEDENVCTCVYTCHFCIPKLAPALLVHYWRAHIRGWLQEAWKLSAPNNVEPPDLLTDLRVFARSQSVHWMPSVRNIPVLAALSRPSPGTSADTGGGTGGRNRTNNPTGGRGAVGDRVENPHTDPRYTGNNPFATNIRNRRVADAIARAGRPPPTHQRNGQQVPCCVSYHCRRQCNINCDRAADHVPLTPQESDELYQWCQVAYA